MENNNIFDRMRAGELIRLDDPDYPQIYQAIQRAFRITGELNAAPHDDELTRRMIGELTGEPVDASTWIIAPYYTDFGLFTRFGRDVFVNFGCTFMDRGGITIEDGALIGPQVKLITENHAEQPELRRHVYGREIVIGRGAWLGAGVTILPGVRVGAHAIVGAGSVVTHDVPDGAIVAGIPARVIRMIER